MAGLRFLAPDRRDKAALALLKIDLPAIHAVRIEHRRIAPVAPKHPLRLMAADEHTAQTALLIRPDHQGCMHLLAPVCLTAPGDCRRALGGQALHIPQGKQPIPDESILGGRSANGTGLPALMAHGGPPAVQAALSSEPLPRSRQPSMNSPRKLHVTSSGHCNQEPSATHSPPSSNYRSALWRTSRSSSTRRRSGNTGTRSNHSKTDLIHKMHRILRKSSLMSVLGQWTFSAARLCCWSYRSADHHRDSLRHPSSRGCRSG